MYTSVKEVNRAVRVLVVRLGAMGDVIHTLPAVASLKHSLPGSQITWVIAPKWAPLLDGNVFVDRRIPLERGTLSALLRSRRQLQREQFDFAVDFQGLIQSALVASMARSERIFGFDRSQVREKLAALFYSTYAVSTSKHVVDRNLDLARAAGAASVLHTFPLPPGEPGQPLPAGDFVLACPLAGWVSKQWPLESYAGLANRLERTLGIPLVVNGPPASADILARIDGAQPHVSDLPGLIDATRRAIAVVGVDSGPLHLAAALEKPGIAIFGPTDPERNGPYGGSLQVLRSPRAVTTYKRLGAIDRSMREITADDAFSALERQLRRRAATVHSA
jgi:lipopolysaccharide heptosyltransferase I